VALTPIYKTKINTRKIEVWQYSTHAKRQIEELIYTKPTKCQITEMPSSRGAANRRGAK